MKSETWEVSEPVLVTMGVGERHITRSFPAGENTIAVVDSDTIAVLLHLEIMGLARLVRTEDAPEPKPHKKATAPAQEPAPSKED